MYLVRDSLSCETVAIFSNLECAIRVAESHITKVTNLKSVNIYTLSHTVEQKTERVPVEWETRITLDVKKVGEKNET